MGERRRKKIVEEDRGRRTIPERNTGEKEVGKVGR